MLYNSYAFIRDLAHFQETVNQEMFRRVLSDEALPMLENINLYAGLPMRCK